jgi:hypothetical protein
MLILVLSNHLHPKIPTALGQGFGLGRDIKIQESKSAVQ